MLLLLLLSAPPPGGGIVATIPIATTALVNGVGSVAGFTDSFGFVRVTVTRTSVFGAVLLDSVTIPSTAGLTLCARPAVAIPVQCSRPALAVPVACPRPVNT